MLYIALAFLIGDIGLQCQPALPSLRTACMLWPPALLLLIALSVWALRRHVILRNCLIAAVLGWMWAGAHALWQLRQDLAPEYEGRDVIVMGHVDSIPEREAYGLRFTFAVESASEAGQALRLPSRVELSWYSRTPTLRAAQRWRLHVRLKRRHGFANLGGLDYEAQLFRRGLGATGYVRDHNDNASLGMAQGEYVLRARATLTERIAAALPTAPMQGVIRGLAVGDQQAISGAQWQVFARTGISHLIAISGSHIGMVAVLAAWLGGLLANLPWAQRIRLTRIDARAACGMTVAIGYSLLAGMSVPTQRTLVMLAVYFATQWLRRDVNVWHSFGLALLLCLLIDPFAPLAIGAWLSFGAVAVILLAQQGRLRRDAWWREFLTLQAVVSMGLAPLLIAAFGSVSLVAPLVNLVAIPLFTAILVPAVLLSCAALLIYAPLGAGCLQWLALGMDQVFTALNWAAQAPLANVYLPQAPWWAAGLLACGALIAVLPVLWPLRAAGLLCCLPALLWRPEPLPPDSFELTTLDVGQGLAVVIRTRGHVLLYDTGPVFQSGTDAGLLVILPYLHAVGVHEVDVAMVSHGDDDHAGGMASLRASQMVKQWWVGPSVKEVDANVVRCERGQHWRWDGIDFSVLHPSANEPAGHDNNTSCVLRIAGPGGSALLLGDAEQPVEQQLVARGLVLPTAVVVAGHHGSRSSSTAALVAATQPREVIFSAGYRNRWGFPKLDVVERWQRAGARTDDTARSGAITVLISPTGASAPTRYRAVSRRYWHTTEQ